MPSLLTKDCSIEFKNVGFRYDTTNERAVNNIDIKIEGGKVTALVGQSGAGKSTIINLIPRFYDPQNGLVQIDGQDIKNIAYINIVPYRYKGAPTKSIYKIAWDNFTNKLLNIINPDLIIPLGKFSANVSKTMQ